MNAVVVTLVGRNARNKRMNNPCAPVRFAPACMTSTRSGAHRSWSVFVSCEPGCLASAWSASYRLLRYRFDPCLSEGRTHIREERAIAFILSVYTAIRIVCLAPFFELGHLASNE